LAGAMPIATVLTTAAYGGIADNCALVDQGKRAAGETWSIAGRAVTAICRYEGRALAVALQAPFIDQS